ncbi:MAG TPA: FlgO family outer membrane protein [Thermoanaerobaculia bacterium]|nr:FlgO family outer membrane protein [Thermoanaerobaculia bacterium]
MLATAVSSPAYSQKILAEGIKDLAAQIATNVSKEKKQKVAILPFRELDGKPTILGTYVSEELVTDLFIIGGMEIVERTMLDRVLGEIKLGQTGVIDPETAKRVGKVAGVDAIVTGTITDLQSYVALNCRLIDAQTGRVFGAAQTKIVKDDDVRKIMGSAPPSPGRDGGQPQQPEPPTKPKPVLQQQRVGNLLFELKGCSLSGKLVKCEFLVTNSGEDADVALYSGNSRLFDGEGNEYHADEAILGISKCGGYCSSAQTRLASGIPVKARLSFDGIPPETQRATLVELRAWQRTESTVQFRDVHLARP